MISVAMTERKLKVGLTVERARVLTTVASAIAEGLSQGPLRVFAAHEIYPALGMLYGTARLTAEQTVNDIKEDPEIVAEAKAILSEMDYAHYLVQQADPNPPADPYAALISKLQAAEADFSDDSL
jgi:hypothetical protein